MNVHTPKIWCTIHYMNVATHDAPSVVVVVVAVVVAAVVAAAAFASYFFLFEFLVHLCLSCLSS